MEHSYSAFCAAQVNADWVADDGHLAEVLAEIGEAQASGAIAAIAIDFEIAMQSERGHYSDALRTVQIGFGGHTPRQFVIDCRALESEQLCGLFVDRSLQKLIHNSRFEQDWALTRYGVPLASVYDTMIAMQTIQTHLAGLEPELRLAAMERLALRWEPNPDAKRKPEFFGPNKLGSALERALGLRIPKGDQMSDWGREQLSASQVCYAILDVAVLPPLASELQRIASGLGLEQELATKLASSDARTRERVERELAAGLPRDESARVSAALGRARSLPELECLWQQARAVSLHASSGARLRRLLTVRRLELGGG